MARKFCDKLFGVRLGLVEVDVKLFANPVADNIVQRSSSVRSLKDGAGDFVESEESGVGGIHDHHLAGERAGGNRGAARYINAFLRHAEELPGSCGYLPTLCH